MLTVLQEKLADAHGLAIAATAVSLRVEELVGDGSLRHELVAMRREAEETRSRCLAEEAAFGPKLADDLLARANTTSERCADLVGAWFKADTDALSALAFLAMGEAAEVAAWSAVSALAAGAGQPALAELAAWAIPVQERHLRVALDGAAVVAAQLASDAAPPG